MGKAIKHLVPDRVKPSFVIFDIQALSPWASECPDVKNYKWQLNPIWHTMFFGCTDMATVGVKGLIFQFKPHGILYPRHTEGSTLLLLALKVDLQSAGYSPSCWWRSTANVV